MQDKQPIEYDHDSTDYNAITQRYWPVDRQLLIGSLQLSPRQTVLDGVVSTGLNLPAYPTGVQVTGVDLSHRRLSQT